MPSIEHSEYASDHQEASASVVEESSEGLPDISIIIPVYNDPEGIRTTLESLTTQTLRPDRYEIIVVDNGSTDETRSVVEEFGTSNGPVRLLVESEVQGSYAARNRGIEAAHGEVIAFIDADMSTDPDWLERAVEAVESADADYLACDVELYPETGSETLVGKYNRLTDLDVERLLNQLQFAPTCSLIVRHSLIDDIGQFDSRFRSSGDLEFGNRVFDSGRTLHYAPDIKLYHPERASLRALLKKSHRIGRGKVELHRYYPERYGSVLRRVANPLVYLPPSPAYLRTSISNWEELRLSEQVAFYGLAYATQLSKAMGQLHEAIQGLWYGIRRQ